MSEAMDPSTTSDDIVFVRLLDEGTSVYRPTRAARISDQVYRLEASPNYDPEDETWEFPPGSTVRCERKRINDDIVLVAVAMSKG